MPFLKNVAEGIKIHVLTLSRPAKNRKDKQV